MAIEIERKFLISNSNWKEATERKLDIQQAYLNSHKERTVRVRIINNKSWLTIKGKSTNASRVECEYEIPLEDGKQLLLLCEKPVIEKTRYVVKYAHKIWEIDVFYGANEGLIVAEIELESEDEHFDLPDWVGDEVTHDARYFNSNLIKHPFTQW